MEYKNDKHFFEHLLVAQFGMRKRFISFIENEIKNAKNELPASITIKMNSLEDDRMIRKLYEASKAGVRINLIIRGICCLIPGMPYSKNINVISIVDRFLEHERVFIFHNAGNEIIYLSSADWMRRNLSRRIEVAFPVYNEKLKKEIKDILELQLHDNVKARVIDEKQVNKYNRTDSEHPHHTQLEIYEYLKKLS